MTTNSAINTGTAASNTMMQGQGAGTAPAFSTSTWPATTTISQLLYSSATNTVSGLTTANNGTLVTSSTGVPSILAGPGTTGQIFQSNAAAAPSFSTASYPSTTTINQILYSSSANVVAGLATANNGVLTTGTTGIPVVTALGTDGQVIIGSSAGAPAAATLTAGSNVTITNGHNTITIAASAPGTGTVTNVATAGLATGGPITTTGTVTVTAAVKSDQTTGTSTTVAVVPGVQQYHASAAKAWVMADTAGAASASYNVSSVGDTGTGVVTINFTTNFTSSNYCVTSIVENNVGGSAATTRILNMRSAKAAGNFVVDCVNCSAFSGADPNFYHFACYGAQ